MYKNILFLLSSDVVSSYAYALGNRNSFTGILSIALLIVSFIATIALKLVSVYVLIKLIQAINVFIKNNNKQERQ